MEKGWKDMAENKEKFTLLISLCDKSENLYF